MFEPSYELSDDLDWMLGSEQVPQNILLEVLISDCYPALYLLGLCMLDNPNSAQHATQNTLASVMTQAYRYREEIGARIFIYQLGLISIKDEIRKNSSHRVKSLFPSQSKSRVTETPKTESPIWLAFEQLDFREQAFWALHHLQRWSTDQLASLFEIDVAHVEPFFLSTIGKLRSGIGPRGSKMSDPEIHKALKDTFAQRWPISELDETIISDTKREIEKLTSRQRLRTRTISHSKEFLLVVGISLAIVMATWAGNTFLAEADLTATPIKTVVVTQLVFTTPPQDVPSAIEPRTVIATPAPLDVLYKVGIGDELSNIAGKLGVSEEELRTLNRISPEADAIPTLWLLIPGRLSNDPPQATPVRPASRPEPPPAEPSLSELLKHMKPNEGRYHTIWLDALIVDYGPIGYVGPPKTLRAQVWFSEDQSLILVGPSGRPPEDVFLRIGRNMYRARPSSREPWFSTYLNRNTDDIDAYNELDLLFETIFDGSRISQSAFSITPSGRGTWADQPSVQADLLFNEGERRADIWIDESTGLTLRERWYSTADPQILSQEVAVTNIAYDIDFPQDLFDVRLPWRGGYASDHTGAPETSNADPLPQFIEEVTRRVDPIEAEPIQMAELDYQGGQLTFDFHFNFNTKDPSAQIDIYLDRRFIGTSVIGNPWTSICERSPDGRKLAYVSEPFRRESLDLVLRLINLDGPFGLGRPLDDMLVTHFSWAPDNHRLAVFGYDPFDPLQIGQLLILDTETSERRALLEADLANSLVWRPDGKRLALIVRQYPDSFEEQVLVIDIEDGGIVSRIPLDVDGSYSDHWPMDDWSVDFPVLQSRLEQCAAPK